MPNYDLNGDPLPDSMPGGAPAPQQQYDLAGNPIPQQGAPQGGAPYGQQPPPYGQQRPPYGQPPPPGYGQQPPPYGQQSPYGQQPGAWPPPPGQYGAGAYGGGMVNDSGTGSMAQLPIQLQGFNWGAFLNPFWWSIFNKSYIGLLCIVPYLGWIMYFVLGFKGNEWAWQNRRFDSIEQFQEVQRKWMLWGVALFLISLVIGIIAGVLGAFSGHNSNNSSF